eukprot:gene10747-12536_t
MQRRRDQTIHMLQEKQRQKQLQQQQIERTRNTIDLTTESSANTLPTNGLTTSNNSLGAVHARGMNEVHSAQQPWIGNMASLPLAVLEPFLRAVLVHLRIVDLDGSFTFEITDEVVPGYTAAIKLPMNLTRMQRKLDAHRYLGILPFDSDIQLMISNCHKYHVRNSIFTKTALLLKKEWRRLLSDFQRHVCHDIEQSLPVALTAGDPAAHSGLDPALRVHLSNERAPNKRARTEEPSDNSGEESAGEGNSKDKAIELNVLEPIIQEALDHLLSYDHSGDFALEITDAIAPGYSTEIKVPMDLTKMQRKLDAHQYSSLKQFDSDIQLMVRNCRKFNGAASPFTKRSFYNESGHGAWTISTSRQQSDRARAECLLRRGQCEEEEEANNESEQKDFPASLMQSSQTDINGKIPHAGHGRCMKVSDNIQLPHILTTEHNMSAESVLCNEPSSLAVELMPPHTIGSNGAESDDDITLIDEVE